jgi:Bacterial antitoxin of type II TA system, VapB
MQLVIWGQRDVKTIGFSIGWQLCGTLCDDSHMATNLAIDPDLLERAVAVSGERTKTAAVKRALEEFIARRQQGRIVDLFGTLEWDPKYDYKAARSRG